MNKQPSYSSSILGYDCNEAKDELFKGFDKLGDTPFVISNKVQVIE